MQPGSSMSNNTSTTGTTVASSEHSTSRIIGLQDGRIELGTFKNESVVIKKIKAVMPNLDYKALSGLRTVRFGGLVRHTNTHK